MDPNACLERFIEAENEYVLSGLDTERAMEYLQEMKDAHSDLCNWLKNGGFEPDWNAYGYTREKFLNYYSQENNDE